MSKTDVFTVREFLTKLDGRGLACDMAEQVTPDLLLFFKIGLDTPLVTLEDALKGVDIAG